jgi:calcineurin-like phosphoesterase family protein
MKTFAADKVLFTSDTHFMHRSILKYTSRPFATIEEMNEGLIANWNAIVKPTDTVIHLGDFAFAGKTFIRETVAKLNGSIILVKGNHDEKPPEDCFAGVYQYFECGVGEQDIACFHFPIESWNRMHHGSWHLHGHCHGSLKVNENLKRMDVGIDCHPNHRPFSFMDIEMVMKGRQFVPVDHHQ